MINDISKLRIGTKVHYQPEYNVEIDVWENGMIKEIRQEERTGVWVVYNCAGNWNQYKEYTSAKTSLRDLTIGWRFE